jgi:predicted DNA-binding protein
MRKNMKPFSMYLPNEYHDMLTDYSKQRKASEVVREAIVAYLNGGDMFKAGYNKALKDAQAVVAGCKEIEVIAVNGKYLDVYLSEQIGSLEKE